MKETIAAISTALGVGAISIIRISGPESIEKVNTIFKGKDLNTAESHTINYGYIIDKNSEVIDEVLISIMKAPKTFTTEDIVEINCHGGIATTKKVLELVLSTGIKLAEEGEFTKRAFLNGRIDLLKAESIMDLINSKSENSRKQAIEILNGSLSRKISSLRFQILEKIITVIEVNIDYPEYDDIEIMTKEKVKNELISIKKQLEKIIQESENGKILKNGINTVIIGRPNVGKSSILNRLLDEEKAIVTDIEGTTRDIVEGNITISGVELNIFDTAGIRKTQDIVEQIGVNKSFEYIDKADLIISVFNNNEELNAEDLEILDKIKEKNKIIVINKADLKQKINLDNLGNNIVFTDTISDNGIEQLKERIVSMFNLDKLEKSDYSYLNNARQISLAKEAYEIIIGVENQIDSEIPLDMLEIDIKNAWEVLGKIIGETYEEELLDQLFKQFCLGK
ncbi:MAG: tRNA uridine-5-carboxymethylaminomethyl(34) synthesis GTPase MnmE [Bacilli bacterium]|nr:tRNA uridine-5-carboxymethylaminomethyl(34) synthesis GTPase MnmE [Bacilli bacterium]